VTRIDVAVVGAGLGGLVCARDLTRAGTDVLVVEARDRPGGRVEQRRLADGRTVELGGELVGRRHDAYLELAAELGLAVEPSFIDDPGEVAYDLLEGVVLGESWLDDADRAAGARVQAELMRLARDVDPADPWAHPEAARLDRLSMGDLLRECGATPNAYRLAELDSRMTGAGSIEHISVLGELRAAAQVGAPMGDHEVWEALRLADGSGSLVAALARGLDTRIRYEAPAVAVTVGSPCSVELVGGEEVRADAVVCAIPVGPLCRIAVRGLSDERLRSLHRQRTLLAGKAVVALDEPRWRALGWNGASVSERDLGFWPQAGATLSSLCGPEQLAYVEALSDDGRVALVRAAIERILGPVGTVEVVWRHWGHDPWALGYVSRWAPGDLTAVGPLHGTHEPPFYVAGSDHWVAGYMEGAVATGRAAARVLLSGGIGDAADG
jgi:monoamine oxidase